MDRLFRIYDTFSKDFLEIIKKNEPLKIYVCGITPYDFAHIGHARCYVFYDVLIRALKYFKYDYLYCRNITDIDDKIINKAKNEFENAKYYNKIVERFYEIFKQNLNDLGCLEPDFEPRVTGSIDEIVQFINILIDKGHAYVISDGVYFSVDSFKNYGLLSKRNLDEQVSGIRIATNREKKNNLDFVLWKFYNEEPFWKSPWGNGRPGWHIECSVMAKKNFGDQVDIHGGGMDLIFPHHENEIAQSECCNGNKFSKVWMHVAFVCINKEKMSKSLNNFFTINDVFDKFDAMVFRFYLLQNHYRTPFNFSFEDIDSSGKSYKKLIEYFCGVEVIDEKKYEKNEILYELEDAILNDLNYSKCLGLIFKNINFILKDKIIAGKVKNLIINVLGLNLENIENFNKDLEFDEEIKELIEKREIARTNKDFKAADEIRKLLEKMGIKVRDNKL
jgi:cysteinyl-tRNA synthetase